MEEEFFRMEWKIAEKEGDFGYAKICKELYRELVMKKNTKSYHFVHDALRPYPMIYCN